MLLSHVVFVGFLDAIEHKVRERATVPRSIPSRLMRFFGEQGKPVALYTTMLQTLFEEKLLTASHLTRGYSSSAATFLGSSERSSLLPNTQVLAAGAASG